MESADENFKEGEEVSNSQREEESAVGEQENSSNELNDIQDCHVNAIEPEPEQLGNEEKLVVDENSYVTIALQNEEDQCGEQVYGYLDTRSATLFVQNHLDGASPRLFITQNEDGNEFIVVVSEDGQPLDGQAFPHNAMVQQDVILESVPSLKDDDGNGGSSPALEFGEMVEATDIQSKTDCAGEDSDISESPVWAIRDNVPGQDNSTEMVFIPAQSFISSQLLADDDSNHKKVLHMSPDESLNQNSILNEPLDVARNISENSVIVTKHFSDADSPSELEERENEENVNTPLSADDDTNDQLAQESDQTGSQYSLYSSSRAIDNAVSVIHSPSSYNSLNGNNFASQKSREFDDRKDYNNEDMSHLEDSYPGNSSPDQSFNMTSDNKLLIDEDSNTMSSQTSGLDLSKDSKVRYSTPVCDSQFSDEELKIAPESPVPQERIEEDSDVSVDHISSKASSVIVAMDEESKGRMDDDLTLEKGDSSNAETIEMDVSAKEIPSNEILMHPGKKESLKSNRDECAMEIDSLPEDAIKSVSEKRLQTSEDDNFIYSDPLHKKNDFNRRKRTPSLPQECLLPKKKFRIQPDIEKEIAEICETGNNFHTIVKDSLSAKKNHNKKGVSEELSAAQKQNEEPSILLKGIEYLSNRKSKNMKENGDIQREISDAHPEDAKSSLLMKGIEYDYLSNKSKSVRENGDIEEDLSDAQAENSKSSIRVKGMERDYLSNKPKSITENGDIEEELDDAQAEDPKSSTLMKDIECDYLSNKSKNLREKGDLEEELSDTQAENSESSNLSKEVDYNSFSAKEDENKENGHFSVKQSGESSECSDSGDKNEPSEKLIDNLSEITDGISIIKKTQQVDVSVEQHGPKETMLTSSHNDFQQENKTPSTKEKRNLDIFDLSPEDTFVLPPKITYTSRKKKRSPTPEEDLNADKKDHNELFSNSGENYESSKDVSDVSEVANENEQNIQIDDEDFISPVNIKISANYTRKRKSMPPVVRELRTRSLRPRNSTASDSSEADAKIESTAVVGKTNSENEAKSEEELNWGNILLSTSFQSPSDSHSLLDSKSPKKKSGAKLKKEKTSKFSAAKSEAQWEKFIKTSSPKKLKTSEKKIREKVKKQVRTLCNSEKFISQFDRSPTEPSVPPKKRKISKKELEDSSKKQTPLNTSKSHQSTKIDAEEDLSVKVAGIKYLNDKQPTIVTTISNSTDSRSINSRLSTGEMKDFNCSNCSFSTNKVNNLIMHMKFCAQKEPPGRLLDYSVNDMERRQRIRGEDGSENCRDRNKTYLSNGSAREIYGDNAIDYVDSNEASCSTAREHPLEDSDEDTDKDERLQKRFGYKEKAVVWVQMQDRYWPAVVWRFSRRKAHVFLITSSLTYEKLKVTIDRLHSFDDAKWNNKLLKEAGNFPDKDNFLKAVQKCQSYLNKVCIRGKRGINIRNFFKIPDNVEFSDSDSECKEEDVIIEEHVYLDLDTSSEEDSAKDYLNLKPKECAEYILQGKLDERLLSIYKEKIPSEPHKKFFSKSSRERLRCNPSFGPFHRDSNMDRIYNYLENLFETNADEKPFKKSYIYEVWIPEALINALSVVKNMNLEEAETIFYSIQVDDNARAENDSLGCESV